MGLINNVRDFVFVEKFFEDRTASAKHDYDTTKP